LRFTQIKCLIIVYALFLELIKFKHVVTQILTLGWMENVIKICIMQKFMKLYFQKNLLLMLILLKLDAIMFNLFKFHQQANLIKIELVDGLHLKLINNDIEKIIWMFLMHAQTQMYLFYKGYSCYFGTLSLSWFYKSYSKTF
jgi:hypothetical protein